MLAVTALLSSCYRSMPALYSSACIDNDQVSHAMLAKRATRLCWSWYCHALHSMKWYLQLWWRSCCRSLAPPMTSKLNSYDVEPNACCLYPAYSNIRQHSLSCTVAPSLLCLNNIALTVTMQLEIAFAPVSQCCQQSLFSPCQQHR